jgi:deoxyinosine 3'endonuclease (endonuclease V)
VRCQLELARPVEVPAGRVPDPPTVTGVDVSYETGSSRLVAAAVTVALGTGEVVDEAVVEGTAAFPYRPGLLTFREVPALAEAIGRLRRAPGAARDVIGGHGGRGWTRAGSRRRAGRSGGTGCRVAGTTGASGGAGTSSSVDLSVRV